MRTSMSFRIQQYIKSYRHIISLILKKFLRSLVLVLAASLVVLLGIPSARAIEENASPYVGILEVRFNTDSDWSKVIINGFGKVLSTEYEITQGKDAPGLYVESATPASIYIHKTVLDTTLVELQIRAIILDPPNEVGLVITKGAIGKTEVVLNRWRLGQFEFFNRFVNEGSNEADPSQNQASFRFSTAELFQTGIGVEWETPATDMGKLALAFYYPWYGSLYGPSGRWSHWDGTVKEGSIDTSTDFPIFGAYDSADEQLVEAQVLLAKNSGIDGFISSWWGPHNYEDNNFLTLLKVAERLRFKVTIYYESRRSELTDPSIAANELIYFIENYSNSSAILRIGGKPAIFLYYVESYSRGADFWLQVRKIVEERVGKVFLIGDPTNQAYVGVFDGFHSYIQLDPRNAEEVYKMLSEQMGIGTSCRSFKEALVEIETTGTLVLQKKLTCGTAYPGYDYWKLHIPGSFVDRESGETYRNSWRIVEESDVDWILITSWNEWHEGTEIEPSLQYGFQYLNITREFVSQFKNIVLPEYSAKPDLSHIVKISDSQKKIEISVENKGDGYAIGTRVETNLGTSTPSISSSFPYPHEDTNGIVNYILIIDPGDRASAVVRLSATNQDSITGSTTSVTCYSISGEVVISKQLESVPTLEEAQLNAWLIIGLILGLLVAAILAYLLRRRLVRPH